MDLMGGYFHRLPVGCAFAILPAASYRLELNFSYTVSATGVVEWLH